MNLETLLTSPAAFALTTATPLQRAICRVIEGLPLGDLANDPDVLDSFGIASAEVLPTSMPTDVDILAGIRGAKSMLAACRAFHATQTVDVSGLSVAEVPRYTVLSLRVDLARVVLDHLVGTMQARPALRRLIVGEPTVDGVTIRHPSGRDIEVVTVAGAHSGGSVVARWSAGVCFDEFPRMVGDGFVSYHDTRRAVLGRLLPGASILSIGSPWAPMGPAYDRYQERFGKPTAEHVVVRGRGDRMNPTWWTPARIERMRLLGETAYVTDYLADFADPSEAFITAGEITRATRAEPIELPNRDGRRYLAAMDPATRGNAWTFVLMGGYIDADGVARYEVVIARQWIGTPSAPLSPWAIFKEIAGILAARQLSHAAVWQDQHNADANKDISARVGVRLYIQSTTGVNRAPMFETLKSAMATGVLEIPPDRVLASDLSSIRRRLTTTGITYDLPRSGDGRHADYVPALALGLSKLPTAAATRAAGAKAASDLVTLARLASVGFIPTDTFGPPGVARDRLIEGLSHGLTVDEASTSWRTRAAAARKLWEENGGKERDLAAWAALIGQTDNGTKKEDK